MWDSAEVLRQIEAKGFSANQIFKKMQKRYEAITNSRKKKQKQKVLQKEHVSIKHTCLC